MRAFDYFAAIDWSGAVGPRQPGIAIAICSTGTASPQLVRPDRPWSRAEVLDWLMTALPPATLVGLDFGMALAFADCGAYFPGWEASPGDARALWAFVDALCTADPHGAAASLVDHPEASRHFRRHGNRTGNLFPAGRGRLRVTESAQRAQGLNPTSNFNLVGASQVGKSSLTGMRLLHRLNGHLPVWPFDPLPGAGARSTSVILEIYTSLAARAAGVPKGRSKLRTAAALDQALAHLGCAPHDPIPHYSDHATDAIVTAAWLRTVAHDPALWNPPGRDAVAHTEGWTFGIR